MNRNTYIFNFDRLLWTLAIGISLLVGYISWLAFGPYRTIEFHHQLVAMTPVNHGDPLTYSMDYCKFTQTTPTFTRVLVGKTTVGLADSSLILTDGCNNIDIINTVIPAYTVPGMYHLELNICFQVNPLRNICHQVRTSDFEVK